jgi:hypothetical protein
LLFADDMVLMANGEEELERMVGKVKEYCEEWTRGHYFEQLLGEVAET